MRRKRWRRVGGPLVAIGALALGALTLAGCFVISSEGTSQLNIVGNLQIVTATCSSDGGAPAPVCNDNGASAVVPTGLNQLLVAYRLPDAVGIPPTIVSTNSVATLTQNAGYTSEMQRLFPAPAGQRWVGYMSNPINFVSSPNAVSQAFTFQPEFTLPRAADGGPFVGPFKYRTVVGARNVDLTSTPPASATRPVVCATNVVDVTSDTVTFPGPLTRATTACFDSPAAGTITTDVSRNTRDLGIVRGTPGVVGAPGATRQIPFTLKYAGTSTTSANFAINGASTLPGAIVAPSLGNLQPSTDSSTPVFANVTIPGGAAAGTYSVSLTASLANGQSRTNSVPLTLPLRVAFTLPKNLTAVTARKTGIKITVVAKSRGAATFKVFQGKAGKPAIITKRVTLKKGKNVIVLRSAKLKKGKFRINASGVSLNLNKTGSLK